MRKNFRYAKEYKLIQFSAFIFEKGSSRFKRQRERLLFSVVLDLADSANKPKTLMQTQLDHIQSLEQYLRESRKNSERTIRNKIYLFLNALRKAGIDLDYTLKAVKPKKIHPSKFHRVAYKVLMIEDVRYRKIALLQSRTGLSYSDLNDLSLWFLHASDDGISGYLKPDVIAKLKFDRVTMDDLKACIDSLSKIVRKDYGLEVSTKIFPVKKQDYLAFRMLYLRELKKNGLSEDNLRSIGYLSQWKAYYGKSFFSDSTDDSLLRKKLREFRNNMGIKDNRTLKKYLGLVC